MFATLNKQYADLLQRNFDKKSVARGRNCFEQEKVIDINISDSGDYIIAEVRGSKSENYDLEINISWDNMEVSAECDCPVEYNCKHAVAALLKADEIKGHNSLAIFNNPSDSNLPSTSTSFNNWFNNFNKEFDDRASLLKTTPEVQEHLLYIFSNSAHTNEYIQVEIYLSRVLKKGGYGKPKRFKSFNNSHRKNMQSDDIEILSALQFISNHSSGMMSGLDQINIKGPGSSKWIKAILATKRCFWKDSSNPTLTYDGLRKPTFKWELLPNAHQKFDLIVDNKTVDIYCLDQIWYVNQADNTMGLLDTDAPPALLGGLLSAPEIPPEATKELSSRIKQASSEPSLLPQILNKPTLKRTEPITPEIHLDIQTLNLPLGLAAQLRGINIPFPGSAYNETKIAIMAPTAQIIFDYGIGKVPFSRINPHEIFTYIDKGKTYSFKRDFEKEREYLLQLSDYMDLADGAPPEDNDQPETVIITSLTDEEDFMQFSVSTIPDLELHGWRVVRKHGSFIEVFFDEDLSWYSDLDEVSEYDYFDFKMGIIIDDQKINILPIVSEIMNSMPIEEFSRFSDNERIPIPLPDGRVLSTPFSRIKPILNILIELYDAPLSGGDSLKLSKRQATLLFEIEQAFQASKLRWFGGDRLRRLGKQLNEFKSLKTVNPPTTFKAKLRSYQKDGVNWLQFLREYELGGILADDMGLGKTIQTLAHLSIEKNRGRMKQPSLIIAPTSLMYNWKREAEQFTPGLKVLVYHGENRHAHSNEIEQYNLVLTTYPLLIRDKKILLSKEFYYLILDEAQFIKNHKAKSTQIVQQIKAKHRLCLTGTPMENHLGELWSLFHFIMPGFLGEFSQFKQVFRNPIEKHNDQNKRKSLSTRIRPFMLRRQKNDVLKDLPEKTEIIHTVELQGPQRDLYESIRLSMEKKVRDAVQKKGLSRSHIIILDALLKLRQVCCDPSLLSLPSAKKAHGHSAKLNMLMEMVPNLVEEGRKILIFSQFTKMLGIIENALKGQKIDYVKLTGSTRDREKPVEAFQSSKVPVFLISLKAGGTGLNLTNADTVIHYDPWWNPAVENQATDRAHRYGQKKSVFVYKLQASGTVEETIQQMQQKKSDLVEGLFSEKKSGKLQLSPEDLKCLFKGI